MATSTPQLRFSVLDLAPIAIGTLPSESFRHSLALAQAAEGWGYHRYWLAEHHNIPAVSSAATSVLIGYIAGGTQSMRVGAGGIMLPNHAPLQIAEQFGTLESLYPGRIDLGLGRAPGGDPWVARALRRGLGSSGETFPADVQELMEFFQPTDDARVRSIPGAGLNVPIYLLGSSDFSARLAATLGLPFAFASHFAPDFLLPALQLYRNGFQPTEELVAPYVMVGVNIVAADTDEQARRLFTTLQQQFLNMVRGTPKEVMPPIETMDGLWSPAEALHVERMTQYCVVGSAGTVRTRLLKIVQETGADELVVAGLMYDQEARMRSYELAAQVLGSLVH